MKQRIVISGLGGQGALTLVRLLAECAGRLGLEAIASETHGMAQRGGAVVSMVKVGDFRGPLIGTGQAEAGLFLHEGNLAVHGFYLGKGALAVVNTSRTGDYRAVDASGIARKMGIPKAANLVLLGYAAALGGLFCSPGDIEATLAAFSSGLRLVFDVRALRAGAKSAP